LDRRATCFLLRGNINAGANEDEGWQQKMLSVNA